MKTLRTHLRHNVIAYLALFFALGSTSALAATQLAKNSVGTKQLKGNAVVSSKVKNGSLQAADFAAGQLQAGAKGDPGAKGDVGPQGQRGETGPQGPEGTARAYAYVAGNTGEVVSSRTKGVTTHREGVGEYCVKVDFEPKNLIAMADDYGSAVHVATGNLSGLGSCSVELPGTNAYVVTRKASDGTLEDSNFFVMVN